MLNHIRQGSGEPLVRAHGIHPQMWSRRMRADIRATHDLGDAPAVDAARPRVIGIDRGCGHVPAWDEPQQIADVVLPRARDA